jgi:osmotically-inducible protein OsmY
VKRELAASKLPRSVGVATHHGVVTLTGHVHTASQKRKATAIAGKVAGVKRVRNQVHVGH